MHMINECDSRVTEQHLTQWSMETALVWKLVHKKNEKAWELEGILVFHGAEKMHAFLTWRRQGISD